MPLAAGGEIRVLNALLNSVYVSLHTADPGTTGASEVGGGAYARQPASFELSGANPTVASNENAIDFPQATTNWGTITHFGIWSAATGGTFLGGDSVETPKAITTGDVARWPVGSLEVEAD